MRSTEAVAHTLRLRIREELGCEQTKSRIWPQRAEMHMKEKISGSPDSCILACNRKVLNVFRQEIWSSLLNSHLLIFRLPAPCHKLVCSLTPPHPTSPPGVARDPVFRARSRHDNHLIHLILSF